jgi:hypothetical protein
MDIQEYFIQSPLYRAIDFAKIEESWQFKHHILNTNAPLRTFCLVCSEVSVFLRFHSPYDNWTLHVNSPTRREDLESAINDFSHRLSEFGGDFIITDFACTVCAHPLIFISWLTDKYAMKIGQLPSYADVFQQADKKYKDALSTKGFKEFNTAIGLAAHGVGVGSFVYLRRILEDLEDEACLIAQKDPSWNKEVYQKSRFEERLALLKNELPAFLVENRGVYGIMSKGIHELTDEECLSHFDMLRTAIEMILNEKIVRLENETKRKSLSAQIGKVKGVLKNSE